MGEWQIAEFGGTYYIIDEDSGEDIAKLQNPNQAQFICDTVNELRDALHRCRSSSYLP